MARPNYDNEGHTHRIIGALKLEGPVDVTLSFGELSIGLGDTSIVKASGARAAIQYTTSVNAEGRRCITIITDRVVVDTVGPNSTMTTMTF
jgi:hypothetical protein